MKRKAHLKFTQPITRVHNIFRIRTVVNAVIKENERGKLPSDDEIGVVLAESGLSKYRREKIKDRIMRRARDHLLTASYMGLLTRMGRPFGYSSTTAGKFLQNYGAEEECPKNTREEAVFVDKILRMKLTNVYDLQLGKQYVDLRSRPCLYILHILARKSWLHEHQIAVATGGKRCDPLLEDRQTRSIVSAIYKYDEPGKKALKEFYRDYNVGESDKKNMTRNVRPLLDWCESVGLVTSKEVDGTGRWYDLTARGKAMLGLYSQKVPIWFVDLGNTPAAKAALLIFYQHAVASGFDIEEILDSRLRIGLVTKKISELKDEMKEDIGVNLVKTNNSQIDFTLGYDVPPENRDDVKGLLKGICKIAHMRLDRVIHSVEVSPLEELEVILEKEQRDMRRLFTGRFSERTSISSDPILAKVSSLVPSVGVLGQYKSDFEKEVAILLRLLGFRAVKYQGQLADRCHKTHVMRFFENNPDILIINGIESLVECKSIGEWKSPLSSVKSVPKEFLIYQQYFPEVNSDSVVLIYEGSLDTDSQKLVTSILEDSNDIVFVTKNYLINCVYQPSLRERLLKTIKEPVKFKPEDRILVVH
jgi:hypothetical protein